MLSLLSLLACTRTPVDPSGSPAARDVTATPALPAPTLEDARDFYAAQPRYLQPVPWSPTPAGLTDVRAETCGACHQELYAEWQISTHARAWMDDAQFQAELHKPREGGGDVTWMCVNCHTPFESQLPRLVGRLEGGALDRPVYVDNPNYDPTLQLEAVTCATCHVKDGVILGPWGDTDAPHPVAEGEHLTESALCEQCHQASATFPELVLSCAFETGAELEAGPWDDEGYTCQSCHMPEVERPLVAGYPPRQTRRHWFGGSLIPKRPEDAEAVAALEAHYPEGMALRWAGLPEGIAAGQAVTLSLEIENAAAGHRLPTGDPERFITVEAVARAGGAELGRVDLRLGTVYQWYPEVVELSDDRLAPREIRALPLTFTAPAEGAVELEVVATKHRISEENLAYHDLGGEVVPSRVFYTSRDALPVR